MAIHTLNRLGFVASQSAGNQKRSFFYWLTLIFNRDFVPRVDEDRIKEVGPDLACAEWLLKNGAFVRWKDASELLTDYNLLSSQRHTRRIEAVDANNAGISHVGFPYFKGCKELKEIKLESCRYITNEAIPLLSIIKDTLTNLELIGCKSIDDEGLRDLKVLKNLKTLKIQGLPYIKDKDSIRKELITALPNCKIDFQ